MVATVTVNKSASFLVQKQDANKLKPSQKEDLPILDPFEKHAPKYERVFRAMQPSTTGEYGPGRSVIVLSRASKL